ncbi:hypothetical protein MSG28_002750 [Choristoneura fumiferana]|uniref:Uncharacterized protein n=1 Tax=Choristoneura fumiferana TaxID=7141 RepID=A0ACC0JJ56_CHOFU|nr:hypothetical protein MSG28_002750 [Choristoneura fumiferana]
MVTAQRVSLRTRLAQEARTCCAFWLAVSALPALAISYLVVSVSKHLWLKLLSSRYPTLEFIRIDTVRSLLDTHRNQGIINVMLTVKGELKAALIKQQLNHHVIEHRDKNGELTFPRLRHLLVSCWGNYAWSADHTFNADNHIVVASSVHRGRPEYVSEIVSKYFPSEQPPWQYIIIPCTSPEPKYHILVRVHHLLLSGKKSINIGDLLMVGQLKASEMPVHTEYTQESSLNKLLPTPTAIPELIEKLNDSLSNAWNEFISEYDPVESPRAHKTLPGVFHVAGLVLISATSALRELSKRRSSDEFRNVAPVTATTLLAAVQRECKRRNLTIPKVLFSPLVTADPRKWPRRAFGFALTMTRGLLRLPLRIRDEMRALKELKRTGQVIYPNTLTWKYAGLGQLSARAACEAWRTVLQVYKTPATLWTDTIGADDGQRHQLQTVNLCGRKVASWSRPVSRASMERAARALGVSSSDVALYAATEALRAFFDLSHNRAPETVLTTARAATEDFLFTFAEGDGKKYKKSQTGGMVCLSLPVGATPRRIASVVEEACQQQGALAAAWAAQARYGALTRAVPSPLARLTLNLLSRRYAVSYAEINAPVGSRPRTTLWGHSIDGVVYWRPPQANISMSLTVIQYADSVRLAVMTDARLSPGHSIPAVRWPTAVEQLVAKVDAEIARISAQSQPEIPQIVTPPEPEETNDESGISSSNEDPTSTLRPPNSQVASPPPFRKRTTRH